MPPERQRTLALAALCVWWLGCGEAAEPVEAPVETPRATLPEASERVQMELGRGCDKWKRRASGGCETAEVDQDRLGCWLERGVPYLKASAARDEDQARRDEQVLIQHETCMQQRGWRHRNRDEANFDALSE